MPSLVKSVKSPIDCSQTNSNHSSDNVKLLSGKETKGPPNEDFVLEHAPKKEPEISVRSSYSTRLSSDEIYMVLKHNHLEHPEEDKKDLQKLTLGVLVLGRGR